MNVKYMIHKQKPVIFVCHEDRYFPIVLIDLEATGKLSYSYPQPVSLEEAGELEEMSSYQFFMMIGVYRCPRKYEDIVKVVNGEL